MLRLRCDAVRNISFPFCVMSGKDGAINGLIVLAFDFTLKVNSREFGMGRLGGRELTGLDKALGCAAGTKGGLAVLFSRCGPRAGRCGRWTTLEGMKPGG